MIVQKRNADSLATLSTDAATRLLPKGCIHPQAAAISCDEASAALGFGSQLEYVVLSSHVSFSALQRVWVQLAGSGISRSVPPQQRNATGRRIQEGLGSGTAGFYCGDGTQFTVPLVNADNISVEDFVPGKHFGVLLSKY